MNNPTPAPDYVPWLSCEERAAWMTLATAFTSLPAAIDAQLKRDAGVNFFEYSILVALARPDDHAVQMTNLALMAGGSLSRLSHAVSRLERQGWVRRRVQSGEARCVEAVLTDAGMAALTAAAPHHVREVRRLVFDALTPEQVAQVAEIGRQLVRAASPETAVTLDRAIGDAHRAAACRAAAERRAGGAESAEPTPADETEGVEAAPTA